MKKSIILIQISALIFHYLLDGLEAVECDAEPKNTEGRLRKNLFCGYDRDNRPTVSGGPITIRFKMIVKGFTFDDITGKLSVATWLAMSWTDEHLKWDPKDYGNLDSITQSSKTIWQPDLALYNSDVESAEEEFCKTAHCVITSSGTVSCIPPCSHSAKCSPKYDRWPFDIQNCTLHIGTWVNSGDEIDYKVMKTIISDDELSSQNLEWKLLKATYKRNPGNYSETKQTYPSLTFTFLIERHSGELAVTILIPAITLLLLNLITLWVDSEHSRRIILLSLSLCLHFLYIQHLFWILPKNGDTIPDILIYFRDSLFITIFLIINTIIVQGMLSCTMQTPQWVEKVTGYMGSNRVGQLFLTEHLVRSKSFTTQIDDNADDINLVESQPNEKDAKKAATNMWQTFGNIIDRVIFVLLSLIYLFMVLGLLPEKFLDEKDVKSVEIVGY